MNSLYKKREMTGTYGPLEKYSRRVLRGQLFSKGKFKLINGIFFTQYTLFFQ